MRACSNKLAKFRDSWLCTWKRIDFSANGQKQKGFWPFSVKGSVWRAAFQTWRIPDLSSRTSCTATLKWNWGRILLYPSSLHYPYSTLQCQTKLTICSSQLILKLAPTSPSSKVPLCLPLRKQWWAWQTKTTTKTERISKQSCCKFRLTLQLRSNWAGTVMAHQTLLSSCSLLTWVTMLTARVAFQSLEFFILHQTGCKVYFHLSKLTSQLQYPLPISEEELLELWQFSFLLFNAQSWGKKEIKHV